MKTLLLAIFILFLSGCSFATSDNSYVNKSQGLITRHQGPSTSKKMKLEIKKKEKEKEINVTKKYYRTGCQRKRMYQIRKVNGKFIMEVLR